jgi:polyphosphate kinase 2 (PPK2 family)
MKHDHATHNGQTLHNAAVAEPEEPARRIGEDCRYSKELRHLHVELAKLQEWIRHEGLRVVALFEGRDAAVKGGAIKRITEPLNPRICRVVALGTPTEREKSQWYFQRYVEHLPAAGEMVLFDRSWYNRAGVEHVMGFCTEAEYQEFQQSCPEFERMLVRSGIRLLVLVFRQRRRTGAPLPGAQAQRNQALEAQPHGPSIASTGPTTHAPKTRCSPSPIPSRSRGSW